MAQFIFFSPISSLIHDIFIEFLCRTCMHHSYINFMFNLNSFLGKQIMDFECFDDGIMRFFEFSNIYRTHWACIGMKNR